YKDLDEQILADAEGSPDALPLLEFCLQQLYEALLNEKGERVSDLLTWDHYAQLGGLKGAIAHRSEAVYQSLPPEAIAAESYLFAALVRIDTSKTTAVRQRAAQDALHQRHAGAALWQKHMLEARILVTDEEGEQPVVTLAHEALLTHWTTLRTWIEDHRSDL